ATLRTHHYRPAADTYNPLALTAEVELTGPVGDAVIGEWLQYADPHPSLIAGWQRPPTHHQVPRTTRFEDHCFELGLEPRPLLELIDDFRREAVQFAASHCSEWSALREDYEALLDVCLASRRFAFAPYDD